METVLLWVEEEEAEEEGVDMEEDEGGEAETFGDRMPL